MTTARRLAAILAADVVGYSRLMGADEAGTAKALREHRAAAAPLIAEHGGRIVKTTGDGALIEFGSVVGAVQCAIALQKLMTDRNAGVPDDRRMDMRIGVHLGDVLIEADDILGDGVNIAARLESIAEPGGICISEDAFRQVRGKVDVEFDDIGEQSLKNIARPIRAHRGVLQNTGADASAGCAAPRQAVDRCTAVSKPEWRPRARIFRRRHGRGDHYRSLAHTLALRHRPQFELHLQGPSDRREAGWP
jgi:class 3 adenylate cyclase